MRVCGQLHSPAALPPGRRPGTHCMGGWVGRSGWLRKISPPPGFDPRTVQPIASRWWQGEKFLSLSQPLDQQNYSLCTSDKLHNIVTNCNFVDLSKGTDNTILIQFFHILKYVSLSSMNADTEISYFTGKTIQIMGNNFYSNYGPLTVGSSPYTSSPTAASNIALRISSVGFDTVSLLRSTTRVCKIIQCVPKSRFLHRIKHINCITKTIWLMLFREITDILWESWKVHKYTVCTKCRV